VTSPRRLGYNIKQYRNVRSSTLLGRRISHIISKKGIKTQKKQKESQKGNNDYIYNKISQK
jgi:hypothetical protein